MEDLETLFLLGRLSCTLLNPKEYLQLRKSTISPSPYTTREQSLGKEYNTLLSLHMNSTYLWGKALLRPANTALLQIPTTSGSDNLSTPSSEVILKPKGEQRKENLINQILLNPNFL